MAVGGVTIPASGTGDATPVVAADPAGPGGSYAQTVDLVARAVNYLEVIASALGLAPDTSSGRLRILLDAMTSGLTLTTVTTVSTLTSMSQVGGVAANSTVFDIMTDSWANTVRRNIT